MVNEIVITSIILGVIVVGIFIMSLIAKEVKKGLQIIIPFILVFGFAMWLANMGIENTERRIKECEEVSKLDYNLINPYCMISRLALECVCYESNKSNSIETSEDKEIRFKIKKLSQNG